jgi:hypothetical protein
MSVVDLLFLILFLVALLVILASSPVLRAVLWDTLRHPFTHGRVEVRDGQVKIHHETSASSSQPTPPVGVRDGQEGAVSESARS